MKNKDIDVFVDFGNHSLQYVLDTGAPITIRSLYSELVPGVGRLCEPRDQQNPLVIYQDGCRLHWGETAAKYRGCTPVVEHLKQQEPQLYWRMLLACLPPLKVGKDTVTEYNVTLHWAVPDTALLDLEQFKKTLGGLHTYVYNGVDMAVTVKVADPLYEGQATVLYARRKGAIPSEGDTLFLDLGGGTANILLVDEFGQVLDNSSFVDGGCVKLAARIASNTLLRNRNGGNEVPLRSIMDAIERREFHIRNKPEIHFHDIWQPEFRLWYNDIIRQLLTRYSEQLNSGRITSILIGGGMSNHVPPSSNKLITILIGGETANVCALAKAHD